MEPHAAAALPHFISLRSLFQKLRVYACYTVESTKLASKSREDRRFLHNGRGTSHGTSSVLQYDALRACTCAHAHAHAHVHAHAHAHAHARATITQKYRPDGPFRPGACTLCIYILPSAQNGFFLKNRMRGFVKVGSSRNWKRAPGMRNVFEYQWCEGDRSGLVWK